MRYLFVGLLLSGFCSMHAVAGSEIAADPAIERLCSDFGYQKGSDEFERCLANARQNGEAVQHGRNDPAIPENNAQQIFAISAASGVAEEKNTGASAVPAMQSKNEGKTDAEMFCESYDYTKGSSGYEHCLEFAIAEGYAKDMPVNKDGQRKKKRRM